MNYSTEQIEIELTIIIHLVDQNGYYRIDDRYSILSAEKTVILTGYNLGYTYYIVDTATDYQMGFNSLQEFFDLIEYWNIEV